MDLKVMNRPTPGAKMPPAIKYQMAGVRKLDRGIKIGVTTHKRAAEIMMETIVPVAALEVTKPRRITTCDTAKRKAAWMAK